VLSHKYPPSVFICVGETRPGRLQQRLTFSSWSSWFGRLPHHGLHPEATRSSPSQDLQDQSPNEAQLYSFLHYLLYIGWNLPASALTTSSTRRQQWRIRVERAGPVGSTDVQLPFRRTSTLLGVYEAIWEYVCRHQQLGKSSWENGRLVEMVEAGRGSSDFETLKIAHAFLHRDGP
jgi:hypothetical protein